MAAADKGEDKSARRPERPATLEQRLEPGTADGDGVRWVRVADGLRLPLLAAAVAAVGVETLELVLVRRPVPTLLFLAVGVLVGIAAGTGTARALGRDTSYVPQLKTPPGGLRVVRARLPVLLVLVLILLVVAALMVPVLAAGPTPVGPFAAAAAIQLALHQRGVRRLEASENRRLLMPDGGPLLGPDERRCEAPRVT